MNLRDRRIKHGAEVHTTALNDIMFFLMLFFLLASAVSNPQVVKLLLPRSSAGEQSVAKRTITVSITDDLKYFLDKQEISYEQLRTTLEGQIRPEEDLTIMLYADSTVPIQHVVSVTDIAHKLRVKMFLAIEPGTN